MCVCVCGFDIVCFFICFIVSESRIQTHVQTGISAHLVYALHRMTHYRPRSWLSLGGLWQCLRSPVAASRPMMCPTIYICPSRPCTRALCLGCCCLFLLTRLLFLAWRPAVVAFGGRIGASVQHRAHAEDLPLRPASWLCLFETADPCLHCTEICTLSCLELLAFWQSALVFLDRIDSIAFVLPALQHAGACARYWWHVHDPRSFAFFACCTDDNLGAQTILGSLNLSLI
jgi:hypothetical protein